MVQLTHSAGLASDSAAGTSAPGHPAPVSAALPPLPMRKGDLPIPDLIDHYMRRYAGRDCALPQRLSWWKTELAGHTIESLSDDDVHERLRILEQRSSRYFAGKDASNQPIYKSKKRPLSGATLNRYWAAISSVMAWSIKERVAPKGYVNPCHAVALRPEPVPEPRYLNDEERTRLLQACKAAAWPKLYLLILLAITSGARKGELLGLRWGDVDLANGVAHVRRSKNGDAKTLPLVTAVQEEMRRFPHSPGALIFGSERVPTQPFAFESQWAKALRAAKIKSFRFHDLRHSCASSMAQAGATLLEIADQLGHRQLHVTRRYSHLTTGHRAAVIERVFGDVR